MTTLEWIFSGVFLLLYISFVFTVAGLTFRKGYTVLGILGILMPILWLIGAILPTKQGSRHWIDEEAQWEAHFAERYY